MSYVIPKVTTKKTPVENTQRKMRKESKHVTTKKKIKTEENRKQGTKSYKTDNSKTAISPSLSVTALNVHEPDFLVKTYRGAEWILKIKI
jgi:hypothetical protein